MTDQKDLPIYLPLRVASSHYLHNGKRKSRYTDVGEIAIYGMKKEELPEMAVISISMTRFGAASLAHAPNSLDQHGNEKVDNVGLLAFAASYERRNEIKAEQKAQEQQEQQAEPVQPAQPDNQDLQDDIPFE